MLPPSRSDAALLVAVLAAIVLALSGVLEVAVPLPDGAVAAVNDTLIGREEFAARVDAVARQLERPPGAAERADILARVIDEELLLQQALALGLPRHDARVRSQLVQEVIRQAVAESARMPVSEQELRAFHSSEAAFFRHPPSFRVRRFECRDAARAHELQAALEARGDPGGAGCDASHALLPDAWLNEAKLRDYLGAGLAQALALLAPGQSLVRESGGAVSVLWLAAVQPARAPAFEEIRLQLEAEFRRRRDEAALAVYVDGLRADASVRLRAEE
jgi:SurA N-terminal domain/PPIC-type PPIASE domain